MSTEAGFRPPQGPPRDFLVTGIPRSGTSLLCKLLHGIDNCVVINEPLQIFPPLAQPYEPWGVAVYYGELRRDIRDGKPVENKILDGELVEDTLAQDERRPYRPDVTSADFVLGTKNTLTYLARLPALRRVMPQAGIVACVRHPCDTIGSWKRSFPHLASADVDNFPVGSPGCANNAGWQALRLGEIAATKDLALRRALLWRYLAECVLRWAPANSILRYEDLTTETETQLRGLWRRLSGGEDFRLRTALPGLETRRRSSDLGADEIRAVRSVCAEFARELGYSI